MLWKTHIPATLIALASLLAACSPTETATPAINPESVWSVDLVRTLPGMQDMYLASIEANWGAARALALRDGHIVSYRALATEPDSLSPWDVILLTEDPDSSAYNSREAAFRAIFASPEYVATPSAAPSAEMRAFFSTERPFREVTSGKR